MDSSVVASRWLGYSRPRGVWRLFIACTAAIVALAVHVDGQARGSAPGRIEAEGVLEVYYEDSSRGSRLVHFLDTGTERIPLEWGNRRQLPSATRIRARGAMRNGALALGPDDGGSVDTIALASPNTFGVQSTLVILFNFQDLATQPYTTASAQSVTFTQGNNFYLENSYGQTSLNGTVVGWFTIAASSTTCDYNTWATLADQAATAAGVNLSSYPRHVYGFPQASACAWWGLGTVGGGTNFFPSRAWINGAYSLQVVAHELGHNFGLYHARSEACDPGVCVITEYGDDHDVMGAAVSGHFSAFQKERLGWLAHDSSPSIQAVTGTGDYTLEPYATSNGGLPKAVRILRSSAGGSNTYIYAEARTQLGTNSDLAPGVLIHTGLDTDGREVYEIDLQPSSPITDFILDPGQSITFDDAITISTLSSGDFGAVVGVSFLTAATPTSLSVGPATGTYGGTTNLSATLTAGGSPVQGRTVAFTLNGTAVGSASTDTSGVATLPGISLAGFTATTYPAAVAATFAGDSSYDPSSGISSLTVDSRPVAPVVTAADKVYDATTSAMLADCTITGIVGSDVVSCTGTAIFDSSNAGTGKTVTAIGLTLTGASAANYVLNRTSATTTATITPRVVTPAVTVAAKSYDGTTAATIISCDLTGVLGSDVVICTGTAVFDSPSIGTDKTVTVSGLALSGAAAANYVLATTTVTTTGTIAALVVTSAVTVANKAYDGTTAATLTSCTVSGALAGDVVGCTGAATFDTSNVETDKTVTVTILTLTGAAAAKYTLATTRVTTTAAITALPVTAVVTVSDKPFDKTTTAMLASCTVIGVLSGDVVECTGVATFDTASPGTDKTVTVSDLTLTGAAAGNYVLTITIATTTAAIIPRGQHRDDKNY